MKLPKVGSMRHRVELLTFTTTRQSGGIKSQSWSVQETLYADIKPIFRESMTQALYEANDKEAKQTFDFFIRYSTNVAIKKRLKYDNRTFLIESVADIDERKRFMKIRATELEKAEVEIG